MRFNSQYRLAGRLCLTLLAAMLCGCQERQATIDETQFERYEERMTQGGFEPAAKLTQIDAQPPVALSGPIAASDMLLDATIWLHLPDPSVAEAVIAKRMEVTRYGDPQIRKEYEDINKRTLGYLENIRRSNRLRLSLADALHRALMNSYAIRDLRGFGAGTSSYAPAISTAQVIQAEAAFDLAFFSNINRNNTDRPALPQTVLASQADTTIVSGGIAKLLATGASITLTPQLTRVDNNHVPDPAIDPTWSQSFVAELRQPLLRNFGIDFNRAQINIYKNQRLSDLEGVRARVTDILVRTEQAYWTLATARRNVVILAESLAQANLTNEQIESRRGYDATETDVFESRAAVKDRETQYIGARNQVRDAEDHLLNLLNDPELPSSADFEIIPVDDPTAAEIVRDRFHAVETALEQRPEIRQARYAVENAKLGLGIAKNQALPRLDAVYRMTLNGLGASADQAWDEMSTNNFVDHFVGLELEWHPGERRERAGIRIATLQQSQAVVSYKRALDDVITDCRVALRRIETNFEQIGTTFKGVAAAAESLRTFHERRERMGPNEINLIFQRQANLAGARQRLLQSLVEYNQAIVDVERAKGTLLEYNNVILAEQP